MDFLKNILPSSNKVIDLGIDKKCTQLKTYRKTIQWTIKNYWYWARRIEESEQSPTFEISAGDKEKVSVSFRIYPNGTKNAEGYMSVFLVNESTHEQILDYDIFIVKKGGSKYMLSNEECGTLKKKCDENESPGLGNNKAIAVEDLGKCNQLFKKKALRIGATIRFSKTKDNKPSRNLFNWNLRTEKEFFHKITDAFHSKKLEPTEIFHNEFMSDFTIMCGEGKNEQSFPAHRVILAMSSTVFKEMITYDGSVPGEENRMRLDEEPRTVKSLLDYIYTGQAEEEDIINVKLLVAAEKYKIKQLQEICEKSIMNGLNVGNVIQIGTATHFCGSEEYQHFVIKFMIENWKELKKSSNYDVIAGYSELVMKILSSVMK